MHTMEVFSKHLLLKKAEVNTATPSRAKITNDFSVQKQSNLTEVTITYSALFITTAASI